MKRFSLLLLTTLTTTSLFVGCANSNSPETNKVDVKTNLKMLKQYSISKEKLHKIGNNYVFDVLNTNGTLYLYTLDNRHQFIKKIKVNGVIEPKKLKVFNNKIYLLGYNQQDNKTILLTFDKELKELSRKNYGDKYDTPRDVIIENNNIIIALNSYNNGISNIKIIENGESHLFSNSQNTSISFLIPFNNGYLIAGEVQDDTQNALLVFVDKNFKTIWVRDIDFGLEENIVNIKLVDNKNIIATVVSQNYTGMEQKWDIKLDKNGKIISKNKNFELKDVDLQFK